MTQARHEIEVHGAVGEPVALPLVARPPGPTDPAYAWSLELPEGVEQVDDPHEVRVRSDVVDSHVVVATQTDPAGVAITVLPVRVTVA